MTDLFTDAHPYRWALGKQPEKLMKNQSLSIEVKLPQPGDKEFESFVEKVAEAVLERVSTRLQENPKPEESTPLE